VFALLAAESEPDRGRDLLFGSMVGDTLFGGSDGDQLAGGTADYGPNGPGSALLEDLEALRAIRAEWHSSHGPTD